MAILSPTTNQPSVKWWQSIRLTLIVALVAVSVIPIVIIASALSEQLRVHTIEQVTDQLNSVLTLKTAEIDTWIESAHSTLDILAASPLINKPIQEALVNPDNTELAITLGEALAQTSENSNILESMFIYDLSGTVIIASDNGDTGKVVSRQPYFDASISTNEFYIQPPFYDISTAQLTIIATKPIINTDGDVVGIIAGRLKIDTLSEIMLERSGLRESGETYLVSLENNYFLTPSRFEGYTQNRAYDSFGIEQALNQIEGAGQYDSYRTPAVPVIGKYTWIPQLEAAMLVEIDEAEALSAFETALQSSLQGTLLVGVIVIVIGIFFGQQVSRPIQKLAQTAQLIAAGDFTQRVTVRGGNEISVLGQSFNQMTETLASNIHELDENIQKTEKANRDLAKQTALAREATRLKSEFLATMSHELRTPLNAITGFTGIILFDEDILDDDIVHMLQRIESNAIRLLTLIDDVLDLSKIEAGRVEIVNEPIHIPTLVKQWIEETSVLAENKNIPLTVEITGDFPPSIYGDSSRLTQIVKNLLSNAIKFTDDGYVALKVSALETHWQVSVEDTGIGIPPHAQNYIFDEFRQVDGSSKRVYGGTGLGLAITRNLTLMMNGTIDVSSQLGKGSTFTVRLPLRADKNPELPIINELPVG